MSEIAGDGSPWHRRIRRNRPIVSNDGGDVLPTFDSDKHDKIPHVLEAEQVVAHALGRWATSAGLHGEAGGFVPYRDGVNGREVIKLLAAAAREDPAQAA